MAKKPDMAAIKEFLFRYGERVGLFACIGIALLLLIMGFMGASGPGTTNGEPWDKACSRWKYLSSRSSISR